MTNYERDLLLKTAWIVSELGAHRPGLTEHFATLRELMKRVDGEKPDLRSSLEVLLLQHEPPNFDYADDAIHWFQGELKRILKETK